MGPKIQWVQSYVTDNQIMCVYRAPNEAMVREHARKGGFPADKVSEIHTVIDPSTAEVAPTPRRGRSPSHPTVAVSLCPSEQKYGGLYSAGAPSICWSSRRSLSSPCTAWGISQRIRRSRPTHSSVGEGFSTRPVASRRADQGRGAPRHNREAKYYTLTAAGKRTLGAEVEDWQRFAAAVAMIIAARS